MTYADQTDDLALVSQDPAAWYSQPQAIVDDPQLRHAEKLQLLDEWAHDVGDRTTAADEGMVPDAPGLIERDVRIQDRIIAAQAALAAIAADDAALTLPQRIWQRIAAVIQGGDEAKLTE